MHQFRNTLAALCIARLGLGGVAAAALKKEVDLPDNLWEKTHEIAEDDRCPMKAMPYLSHTFRAISADS